MTRFTLTVLLALVICPSAGASFQVGIAEPGAGPIPPSDVSALGLGLERRTVEWRGEAAFTGRLNWTPGLRSFLVVSSGYPAISVPTTETARLRYCGFVVSILNRYRNIHDVVVWNEPNLAGFWGAGGESYASLLATCSPQIRAAGSRVWAPGMSPSTTAGVADFARKIAARGRHLIDGWDQHDYSAYSLSDKIAAVRAAFGWKVPLLVGESSDPGYLMPKAYCAGAIGWLNFDPWGKNRKAFGAAIRAIRSGSINCGSPPPPPPPKPARTAFKMRWSKYWICPERPDGSIVWRRGLCELDRVRIR